MKWKVAGLSIAEQFREATELNSKVIDELHGATIERLERSLDLQQQIAAHFLWMLDTPFAPRANSERVAFGLFHKTFFGFLSALHLVRQGLFGPARPLLRHIFECLVIGKFCAINEDESLASKWRSGKIIYLSKEVFQKITYPSVEPMRRFWGKLSDYTHATQVSQQLVFDVTNEDHWRELGLTVIYLQMLTECSYHLLNTQLITSSMTYHAQYDGNSYIVPELRAEARAIFRENRNGWARGAVSLVATYKRQWQLAASSAPPRLRSYFSSHTPGSRTG